MKDQKNKQKKNLPNAKQATATVTTKQNLQGMSMEDLVKLAKAKNIPAKLDMNKEALIKSLEVLSK